MWTAFWERTRNTSTRVRKFEVAEFRRRVDRVLLQFSLYIRQNIRHLCRISLTGELRFLHGLKAADFESFAN